MNVETKNKRFRAIVGDDVIIERVATGFLFAEGPVWHPFDGHLTFSDIPGDQMHRWSPATGVTSFRRPSNKANGNAYDADGRLVTCEHATSRVVRAEEDGSLSVIASDFHGKALNSPNDIVVAEDGALWFTDPAMGRREFFGVPREQELDFQGVYRLPPGGGELQLLVDDFEQPNGLCFSPDRSRLFVNDTPRGHIRAFQVLDEGRLEGGDVWAEVRGTGEGVPDGLKTDAEGNVYCTGPGGIHVFGPDAAPLGVILLPEKTANFTWGGDDLLSLFATSSTSIYRMRVKTPGHAAF